MAKMLRWVLLPWWLLRVFSEQKSLDGNPILGSQALARRGLHVWRARLAHRISRWRRSRLRRLVSAAARDALERDGFVLKRDFLPPELFEALRAQVSGLSAESAEFKEGDAITRRIPLTPQILERLPAARSLLAMSEWRGLTRYVSTYDAEPMAFVQTIFSQAAGGGPDPQNDLHMDTFHPTMKAWLFLEDVADEDGPFVYAPGSHRRTPRREAWERRRSIAAVAPGARKKGGSYRIGGAEFARLGYAAPRRFAVPANTLVVADTYGFHARGRSRGPSVRVEIWAYSRKNPFVPWTGPDLSALPGVRAARDLLGALVVELRRRTGLPMPAHRIASVSGPKAAPAPWPAPGAAQSALKPSTSDMS